MNVVVIGAGVVGCAVAYELAARGASVRVLDAREVGQGATRASAGVLCPYIEGHAAALLQLGARSLGLYDDFLARVSHDARQPIEYERNGTLEIATSDEEAAALKSIAARHRSGGVEHKYVDGAAARSLEPAISGDVTGALLVPVHGYVVPTVFTSALAAAAIARGASLSRNTPVRRIEPISDRLRVSTDSDPIEAGAGGRAAGSWSQDVGLVPRPPVKPIRGQLLHLRFESRPVSRVIWGAKCYLVPWQDGSLLVGATVEDVGFDERATADGVRNLLNCVCDLIPSAERAIFQEVRVGLRPATTDELPIVGPSSRMPGVFFATGHYRNGVLLAPLTAQLVADAMLESRVDPLLAAVSPARFSV